MRRLLKTFIKFLVISALLRLVGAIASRALEGGTDPDDDDFRLAAILDGRQANSESAGLRSITITSLMGGIDLDLTEATLAEGGAHLDARIVMGGTRVVVPGSWRVYTVEDVKGGGVEVQVADPDELPDDAATLTVAARVRAGGMLIEAAS